MNLENTFLSSKMRVLQVYEPWNLEGEKTNFWTNFATLTIVNGSSVGLCPTVGTKTDGI